MIHQSLSLHIQPLPYTAIVNALQQLPHIGIVKVQKNGFSYIDIDDRFIHDLYPLLQHQYPRIKKPDYFDPSTDHLGAHISLTYPEENTQISHEETGKYIEFSVTGLFYADLANKRYFVLGVQAPVLLQIRHRYKLTDKLQLKGHFLEPHITIATGECLLLPTLPV